jgi:hypothetical protein
MRKSSSGGKLVNLKPRIMLPGTANGYATCAISPSGRCMRIRYILRFFLETAPLSRNYRLHNDVTSKPPAAPLRDDERQNKRTKPRFISHPCASLRIVPYVYWAVFMVERFVNGQTRDRGCGRSLGSRPNKSCLGASRCRVETSKYARLHSPNCRKGLVGTFEVEQYIFLHRYIARAHTL